MNLPKHLPAIFMASILLVSSPSQLQVSAALKSETTGWVNGYDLKKHKLYRSKERNKYLPVKIQCKSGSTAKGDIRKNMLIKIDFIPRTQDKSETGTSWIWRWAPTMKPYETKNARRGYKLVSKDSFKRASGMKIECAVWHRPRKK